MTAPANSAAPHGIRFEVAAFSEQGPRSENQDAYSVDAFERGGLLALADGMGGERSGRTAAREALRTLEAHVPIRTLEEARRAVREADRAVTEAAAADPVQLGGMGCALGLLSLSADRGDGPGWIGAHVGDVRILSRSPDGVLRLETRDHTPAFARWEAGEIALDEVADAAGANRLQRAIGRGGEADVVWLPARPGWSWLIVSDGVYKSMRLDELAGAMERDSAAEACETIRRKVEERGPEDNFTAVLVRARGAPSGAPLPDRTQPMTRDTISPGRRAGGAVAISFALLALVVAGLAFWTAREARLEGAQRGEVDRLRSEVDSLRVHLMELSDPFGPTEPATTTPLPGSDPTGVPGP